MKQVVFSFRSFEKEKENKGKDYVRDNKESIEEKKSIQKKAKQEGEDEEDREYDEDGENQQDAEYVDDGKYQENRQDEEAREYDEDGEYVNGGEDKEYEDDEKYKNGEDKKDQSKFEKHKKDGKVEEEKSPQTEIIEKQKQKNRDIIGKVTDEFRCSPFSASSCLLSTEQKTNEEDKGLDLQLVSFPALVSSSIIPSTSFVLLDCTCEEKAENITKDEDEREGKTLLRKITECAHRSIGDGSDSKVQNEADEKKNGYCENILKDVFKKKEALANEETCLDYSNKCNAFDGGMPNLILNKSNMNNDEITAENNNAEINSNNRNDVDRTNDYHLKNFAVTPSCLRFCASSVFEQLHAMRDFKVTIVVSSIGNAPRLKQSKFLINGNSRFASLVEFLKRALKRNKKNVNVSNSNPISTIKNNFNKNYAILNENNQEEQQLFVYVNNAIEPQLDDYVADLFNAFSVANCLRVSYSFNPAY